MVTAAREHGRARDGPLQPHHLRSRRPGGPAGIPRRRAGRDRRLDAVLSGGQRRPPARQGRVRRLDPRPATPQRAGLRPRRLGPRRSTSSTTRKGPSLPPPQAALEADYKRVLGDSYGIVVQPALHARQHADPALRLDADVQGRVRRLSRHAAARASRREPRRRDVPQPHLGRLARLCLRLRLQPDARPAAGARRHASACICPNCSTTTSTAIRSASPAIASAAPPARARAAAAR